MEATIRNPAGLAPATPLNGTRVHRLRSWKEIAAFFGTDERTVKRWESRRGLPVQRVPGGSRTPVFADVAELERWIRGEPAPAPPPDTTPPVRRTGVPRRPERRAMALAALVLAVAAGGAAFHDYHSAQLPVVADGRHEPPQKAVDLYTAAVYQAERATPDGLRRAIGLYGESIAEDPAFAEAYAGLARAYIRLRVFAAVTEAEAYPRARAAAERALELDPGLSQAHAAIGYVAFYSDWDFARGVHHFGEAVRLDPRSATGRYQYAMALLHAGDAAAALRELEVAQRLDPRARGILADKGFVLYVLGRRREGLGLIRQAAADDPDYMMPHQYLALIHLAEGDWRAGLDQAEIVARSRRDEGRLALAAPARRALAEGGGEAMLRVVLAGQLRLHAAGREPAYVVAESYALLGDRAAALRWLRRSVAAREPLAMLLRIDPLLRNLHGDPGYRDLVEQVGRGG